MHVPGFAPRLPGRPGVGRVHPLTEAYSSSLTLPDVSGEPAGCRTGAPEVKVVREGDLVTSLVWPP